MKSTVFLAVFSAASMAIAGVLSARDAEDSDIAFSALGNQDYQAVRPLDAEEEAEAISTPGVKQKLVFKNILGQTEYYIRPIGDLKDGQLYYSVIRLDKNGGVAKKGRSCCYAGTCCSYPKCKFCVVD